MKSLTVGIVTIGAVIASIKGSMIHLEGGDVLAMGHPWLTLHTPRVGQYIVRDNLGAWSVVDKAMVLEEEELVAPKVEVVWNLFSSEDGVFINDEGDAMEWATEAAALEYALSEDLQDYTPVPF